MNLPRSARAVIDLSKLTDYLLSSAHPVGRFKATFFAKLGYFAEDWGLLETVLLEVAVSGTVQAVEDTPFGRKYRVHGRIEPPIGGAVSVVTVWIVRSGEDFPRFVTAFPGEDA